MSKNTTPITWNGPESIRPLLMAVEDLRMLDGNPRLGDVAAVARSYAHWGQRKPIVARTDGEIIAGNHQYQAALQLGWSHIAVVTVEEDRNESLGFALADNRTADLGTYDQAALDVIITSLDPVMVEDAGYIVADGFGGEGGMGDDPASGSLLETLAVTIDDPTTQVEEGQVWILGPHVLACVQVGTAVAVVAEHGPGRFLAPYPDPFLTVSELGKTTPLLLVQPDTYLAGHTIDIYNRAHDDDAVLA